MTRDHEAEGRNKALVLESKSGLPMFGNQFPGG